MNDDLTRTVRIHRDTKVGTDSQGRSVWTKPIELVEFELVSTATLRQILNSDDEEKKQRIRAVADGGDGVLARDTESNRFEILADNELEAALRAADDVTQSDRSVSAAPEYPDDQSAVEALSLVTTQALRVMLNQTDEKPQAKVEKTGTLPKRERGFNPYDSG